MSLVLANVSRRVGPEAWIDDVSLTLGPGAVNVLLGPTRAGKTSLMRLMAGLDAPSAGRILAGGKDVTGVHVRRRSVAMVYQQFINYPNLTVFENIASPLRVARRPREEIRRKVQETARLLQLEPFLDRLPQHLSGGQQQRTAIARALVKGAELVLLDEPLANLDYKLREELREELPRLFAGSGAIFVYATTDPTEALLLGGNTATLHEGRLTQFGRTAEVYRRPADLVSARVFSDPPLNELPIEKAGGLVRLPHGEPVAAVGAWRNLADGGYRVAFRANELLLERPGREAIGVTAKVAVTEITGSESFIHVEAGGARWVAVVRGVREFVPGDALEVFIDPARVFVFGDDGRLAVAPPVPLAA